MRKTIATIILIIFQGWFIWQKSASIGVIGTWPWWRVLAPIWVMLSILVIYAIVFSGEPGDLEDGEPGGDKDV